MKHRVGVLLAVFALTGTVTSSALAFDCMRVSSSLQGLESSTGSGMWKAFDMTPGGGGVAGVLAFFGVSVTPDQLACIQNVYSASSGPTYFALGTGVAGGKTGNGPGVLASNAPSKVLQNGTGIDHFDATVLPVFQQAAATCL